MNSRSHLPLDLLPLRSPRQPRLVLHGGPDPSPVDGVFARWKRLGYNATMLAIDTAATLAYMVTLQDGQGPENTADTPSLTLTPRESLSPTLSPMSNATDLDLERGESSFHDLSLPFKRVKPTPVLHPSSVRNICPSTSTPGWPSSTTINSTQLSSPRNTDSQLSPGMASSLPHPCHKTPKSREHIHIKIHQANVIRQRKRMREEIARELSLLKCQSGFASNFPDFTCSPGHQLSLPDDQLGRPSTPVPLKRRPSTADESTAFLQNALDKASATLDSPERPKPFAPTFEQLYVSRRAKGSAIGCRLQPLIPPLPSSLPSHDEKVVDKLLRQQGVISKFEREQVSCRDIILLRPGQRLNDELINFYGAMILARSETSKGSLGAAVDGVEVQKELLNIHYFSSFFWSKLTGDGYDKGKLSKWTKKIDIFSKDAVLIPVYHRNAHWTVGVINFRKKRIESYDSMGMAKDIVFRHLRVYLDAEYANKKKNSFDFTGWENWAPNEIPQQENGFDCGVFTCQFLESLSRGKELFNFSQKDMPYLRRRMIWEIGNAKLWNDH